MPTVDPGGILDHAMPLPASRVMVVCNHCDRPTRIAHRTLDNGTRVRVCKHCGEPLEVKS
jgi:large subunit ribosomal protein L24